MLALPAEQKQITEAEFQKYNFFRDPDWRWSRVLSLIDRKPRPGRCTRRDDSYVRLTRNFVSRFRNAHSKIEMDRLKYEHPALFFAYDFHARAVDDPESTAHIEARILARQTSAQIAEVMGLMPETVDWYARLFFDVRDRIDQRDWITKQVIVPALLNQPTKEEVDEATTFKKDHSIARPVLDGTLKLFAYFGGTHLVDLLISGMEPGKPLVSPDDLSNWFDRTISTTVRRRVAQAAMTFEINKYNVMELFAIHNAIMTLERTAESESQTRSEMEKHIGSMIADIPWATGQDGAELSQGTTLGRLDEMASELRDDEILQIASGQPVPALATDSFLKELPPSRKNRAASASARELD